MELASATMNAEVRDELALKFALNEPRLVTVSLNRPNLRFIRKKRSNSIELGTIT